jgi:hypothetical protein
MNHHTFVHRFSDSKQAVIAQDGRFARPERARNAFAFAGVINHAGEIIEDDVIFEKSASVLRDGIEQSPKRRPCFSV